MRIYLDNAATSWPKPDAVYEASDRYMRQSGAPAGRGSYSQAEEVGRQIKQCRLRLANLLSIQRAETIAFTGGGTDSLNIAIHGLLEAGDHVVTTTVEHNSVLRPLRWLEVNQGVTVTRVASDSGGVVSVNDLRAAIRPETKMIAMLHVSNVTGAIQPVADVVELARDRKIITLLDACQSLGHLPFSVKDTPVDLLACSAHKGLMGPLGLGVLYVAEQLHGQLSPLRQGGTGTDSDQDVQPEGMPDKLESGNLNVPAILGLDAALQFIQETGLDTIHERLQTRTAQLRDGFLRLPGVEVHAPAKQQDQLGVVSMSMAGMDSREVAAILDQSFGIQVRAGMHCAPLVHEVLGTKMSGGTVRFSPGWFTSDDEIQQAIAAVTELSSTSPAKLDGASS